MGKKRYWYSASIYLPEDYQSVAPVRTTFHSNLRKGLETYSYDYR